MEINIQLFEDVLSGKLKGKFVLRNNKIIESSYLQTNPLVSNDEFPYVLIVNDTYIELTGKGVNYYSDIIDFLPTKHRDSSYQTQAEIHPEFAQLIEKCIKYSEEWSNPLRNDAGGSDQFRKIQLKLLEIKKELKK